LTTRPRNIKHRFSDPCPIQINNVMTEAHKFLQLFGHHNDHQTLCKAIGEHQTTIGCSEAFWSQWRTVRPSSATDTTQGAFIAIKDAIDKDFFAMAQAASEQKTHW
jgi:hypothetical protein